MERKKVSQSVPVQSIIPRSLYAEVVRICAESDLTIKGLIKDVIMDYVKHYKFLYREWQMSDEQFRKAMTAYDVYTTILEEVENLHKEKVKKLE